MDADIYSIGDMLSYYRSEKFNDVVVPKVWQGLEGIFDEGIFFTDNSLSTIHTSHTR